MTEVKELRELKLDSALKNMEAVLDFVSTEFEGKNYSKKFKSEVSIAVEEIFVNIAHYAYNPDIGEVVVRVSSDDHLNLCIELEDVGVKFNPLENADPDITLSVQDRKIGGLGVFMVKKLMDEITYRYENGKNILTLTKQFK
jgi:serine/threonine-protein kinase RsbW